MTYHVIDTIHICSKDISYKVCHIIEPIAIKAIETNSLVHLTNINRFYYYTGYEYKSKEEINSQLSDDKRFNTFTKAKESEAKYHKIYILYIMNVLVQLKQNILLSFIRFVIINKHPSENVEKDVDNY